MKEKRTNFQHYRIKILKKCLRNVSEMLFFLKRERKEEENKDLFPLLLTPFPFGERNDEREKEFLFLFLKREK